MAIVNAESAEKQKETYKIGDGSIEEHEKGICKRVNAMAHISLSKVLLTFLRTSLD